MISRSLVVNHGGPNLGSSYSCRLYGIPARQTSRIVVLRRGPSKWVQVILWHTKDDIFDYGQWFHGRIYEQRCDLSPDGSLFIYFALKINRHTLRDPEYTFAWTAISKPPYLTALALWPQGDTYYGGGSFVDERVVELAHHPERAESHRDHNPRNLTVTIKEPDPQSEPQAFARPDDNRLARDGWELREAGARGTFHRKTGWKDRRPSVWQKINSSGRYRLVRIVLGDGTDEIIEMQGINYSIEDIREETGMPIAGAGWADWDHRDRLVFAREGRLYASSADQPMGEPEMLADFNEQRPYELITPEWARVW